MFFGIYAIKTLAKGNSSFIGRIVPILHSLSQLSGCGGAAMAIDRSSSVQPFKGVHRKRFGPIFMGGIHLSACHESIPHPDEVRQPLVSVASKSTHQRVWWHKDGNTSLQWPLAICLRSMQRVLNHPGAS